MNDPMIVVAGDFNRRDITKAYENYPDINLIDTPPTRGDAHLDLIATNIDINNVTLRNPLSTPEGIESDHGVLLCEANTNTGDRFEWKTVYT